MSAGRVVVVGSANVDVVVALDRRPEAGETVLGRSSAETVGGKGVNQALAAARSLPAGRVAFVGCVGDDDAGREVLAALAEAGVDARDVRVTGEPTGRAHITVTPDGENSIVVLPNANASLSAVDAGRALDASPPAVVVTQLETGDDVVVAVAQSCERIDARLLLNPSPVRAVAPGVLAVADRVIVNAAEARSILGAEGRAEGDVDADLASLARRLAEVCRSAIVTAGREGAVVAVGDRVTPVAGVAVRAVDTTGAGDAFAGTVAARLAAGDDLVEAARAANAEAARLVQLRRDRR